MTSRQKPGKTLGSVQRQQPVSCPADITGCETARQCDSQHHELSLLTG